MNVTLILLSGENNKEVVGDIQKMLNRLSKGGEGVPEMTEAPDDIANTCAMATFGRRVMKVLEGQDEWSADTADAISTIAIQMGIAETDEEGMFRQL